MMMMRRNCRGRCRQFVRGAVCGLERTHSEDGWMGRLCADECLVCYDVRDFCG